MTPLTTPGPVDGDARVAGSSAPDAERGPGDGPAGPLAVVITGEDWLDAMCPFLRARDGSWRSASPAKEHRCWATDPPSELAVLTQQRLCLVRSHDGCERFLHAQELRASSLARERPSGGTTAATVRRRARERRGLRIRDGVAAWIAGSLASRRRLLMVGALSTAAALAALALILGGAGGSGQPGPSGAVRITPVAAGPSGPPDAVDATPGVDGLRRYRVRPGDTLRTIAERFGVSVRQLRGVNDLGDPPRLEPGDVILVPQPQ